VSLQTIDQRRAKHAWEAVQAAKELKEADRKKFGNHARKLPTRIMAAGLGQALAFLYAKGYADLLLRAIGEWVLRRPDKGLSEGAAKPGGKDDKRKREKELLEAIVKGGTSDTLRRHTVETLAYLQWLVRFAEAEGLMDKDGGESDS
jgi:CRISPR-associated protein Cmr5